jgi:hypothetical protein
MAEVVLSLKELGEAVNKRANGFTKAGLQALTGVAKTSILKIYDEMKKVFDKPTPKTLNSLYVKVAPTGEAGKDIWVEVRFKDRSGLPYEKYLSPEIFGGPRGQKGLERKLAPYLKYGFTQMVPTRLAPLDQYGNIKRQVASKMVADIVGHQPSSERSPAKTKGSKVQFSIGFMSGNRPAIFSNKGNNMNFPVMIGIKQAKYKARLPFYEIIDKTYDEKVEPYYEKALKENLL